MKNALKKSGFQQIRYRLISIPNISFKISKIGKNGIDPSIIFSAPTVLAGQSIRIQLSLSYSADFGIILPSYTGEKTILIKHLIYATGRESNDWLNVSIGSVQFKTVHNFFIELPPVSSWHNSRSKTGELWASHFLGLTIRIGICNYYLNHWITFIVRKIIC